MIHFIIYFKHLFIILLLTKTLGNETNKLSNDLKDKTIVFVSGWPQSGTSLIQQIFTITPDVSTMVLKCNEKFGSKCLNWNNEGQWLLNDREANRIMIPGAMCYVNGNGNNNKINNTLNSNIKDIIIDKYKSFWNLDKSILVEKSPQSLLKISLMENIFNKVSLIRKYIIVIKHPVTLNVAIPKDIEWRTHKIFNKNKNIVPITAINSIKQMNENMNYFIHFLEDYNNASDISSNSNNLVFGYDNRCDILGWLSTMELLSKQLNSNITLIGNNKIPSDNVRILHYEDFDKGNLVCKSLMEFIFDSNNNDQYNKAVSDVCNEHFPRSIRTHITTQINNFNRIEKRETNIKFNSNKNSRKLLNDTNFDKVNNNNNNNRKLRLKINGDIQKNKIETKQSKPEINQLNFQPSILAKSVATRLRDFSEVLKLSSIEHKQKINELHLRMSPFGYGLIRGNYELFRQKENLFDRWDLIKRYKKKNENFYIY